MSKAMKNMISADYQRRLIGQQDGLVIGLRGVKGVATTRIRAGLAKRRVRVTMVKNSLARRVLEGTPLAPLSEVLEGASAVVYGEPSAVEMARELVRLLKDHPAIELKGAVLDGQLFKGKAGVEELSKYPTRDEAIGRLAGQAMGPGRSLAAQIKGPGATIAGLVKAIESKLEKGEPIAARA